MILRRLREKIVLKTIKTLTPNMGGIFEKLYFEGLTNTQLPRPMIKFLVKLNWKNLVGAEVGVLAGENSANMLDLLNIKILYAIDPYLDVDSGISKKIAFKLLENKPVKWFIEKSVDASKKISEPLDFVYIDAGHDYDNVKADVQAWYPLVKTGGIIGGHDFTLTAHDGLTEAVIEFAKSKKIRLNISCPDWWVIKNE
jgi:predicted O-methyltransferase YrrM